MKLKFLGHSLTFAWKIWTVMQSVPEKHESFRVYNWQNRQGHEILHDEDDHGEAVLVDVAGEDLGADLHDDHVGEGDGHSVHGLVQEQWRCHCNKNRL